MKIKTHFNPTNLEVISVLSSCQLRDVYQSRICFSKDFNKCQCNLQIIWNSKNSLMCLMEFVGIDYNWKLITPLSLVV